MGPLDLILAIVALLVIVAGLFYTYMVGRQSNAKQSSEMDTAINEKVQEHYVLRNPVFLAYLIAAVLVILYIAYIAMSS
ncbi:hypothetical protein [Sutcliffiella deserti]|uniref:hypothetical protein n=1 Tax=Sutcliffiella deserti TaxID=2875501 RepID=UPI001CC1873D|nr:hypothetical protein [Sutcliffiella deserti]